MRLIVMHVDFQRMPSYAKHVNVYFYSLRMIFLKTCATLPIKTYMLEVKLEIIGTSPLLMHNIEGMKNQASGSVKQIPTPEAESASSLYWTKDKKSIAIPAVALHAALMKAGAKYKASGKTTLQPIICTAIHIEPEMIPLNTVKYEIYTCGVVVQKNRIFRARARINTPWKCQPTLWFDEDWFPVHMMRDIMPQVIKTAGMMIGLCDWRPEKKGQYGKFRLGRLELMPRAKQEPVPEPEILGFEEAA